MQYLKIEISELCVSIYNSATVNVQQEEIVVHSLLMFVNKMYHSKYGGVTNCVRIFTHSCCEIHL